MNTNSKVIEIIGKYLQEVDGIESPKKADVQKELQNIISSNLQVGAIFHYIKSIDSKYPR